MRIRLTNPFAVPKHRINFCARRFLRGYNGNTSEFGEQLHEAQHASKAFRPGKWKRLNAKSRPLGL